jgi:hypothetical protein
MKTNVSPLAVLSGRFPSYFFFIFIFKYLDTNMSSIIEIYSTPTLLKYFEECYACTINFTINFFKHFSIFSFTQTSITRVLINLGCWYKSKNIQWIMLFFYFWAINCLNLLNLRKVMYVQSTLLSVFSKYFILIGSNQLVLINTLCHFDMLFTFRYYTHLLIY